MNRYNGTPAPWVVDTTVMSAINSSNKHVALVNYSHRGVNKDVIGDEHNANAHLIATAPELLEALIECKKWVLCKELRGKAEAAIAKALG